MIEPHVEAKRLMRSVPNAADRTTPEHSQGPSAPGERKQLERQLWRSNLLLQAVSQAQQASIAGTDIRVGLSALLRASLTVTQAHLGYVAVRTDAESNLFSIGLHRIDDHYITGEASGALLRFAAQTFHCGRAFLLQPSLDDATIESSLDGAATYYLGLPITLQTAEDAHTKRDSTPASERSVQTEIAGVLVISGSTADFDQTFPEFLQPLLVACAQLILTDRTERRRRIAEDAVSTEREAFAQRLADQTDELRFINNELMRAARAKDEFLATMNHELRTPLHALTLYAESLHTQRPGPLNERQQRAVGGILESANHLLLLINDVLDIAKMDAGKLALEFEQADVACICHSTLRLIYELAHQKQIEVIADIDPKIDMVEVDERRLKQMLVNLLSNAIKFTPNGGRIGLEVRGNPHADIVHFAVWDTGIGIAPSDLNRLFLPFVQLNNAEAKQYEGTGLGLFLVHRMAELHGGKVTVDSEPGQGSRFTISLPRYAHLNSIRSGSGLQSDKNSGHEQETTVTASRVAPSFHGSDSTGSQSTVTGSDSSLGKRALPAILIADDNEANMHVLSDYLHDWNYRLLFARTGVEALQLCRDEHPDLVLLDIQMPGMTGLDVIRTIRAEETLRRLPIIALTALAMPGDRERCLAAGADDYLSKPLNINELSSLIGTYLPGNPPIRPL